MSVPPTPQFRFGEVAHLSGVKSYVLRFWETEFEEIAPEVLDDGSKIYSQKDLEVISRIKNLLFDHKLSLTEAKMALRDPHYVLPKVKALKDVPTVKQDYSEASLVLNGLLNDLRSIKNKHGW